MIQVVLLQLSVVLVLVWIGIALIPIKEEGGKKNVRNP